MPEAKTASQNLEASKRISTPCLNPNSLKLSNLLKFVNGNVHTHNFTSASRPVIFKFKVTLM